ncbi:acetyl-CoA hydrolase [Verrucomicrobia bacterium IMCC26134]|nr:acetyl-CoA hydrolase [Verrucomicrobia bacterium IMCC26134]
MPHPFPIINAQEAAALIHHGNTVAFGGFTPSGSPKDIPTAIAGRAMAEHAAGRPFQIGVITGASTGASLDGALAKAEAISFRTPYQSDPDLRRAINAGKTRFFDLHLSQLPQHVRTGALGPIHWTVLEACDITADGRVVLTSGVGAAPTFARCGERILIELNQRHPASLCGIHDIYEPIDPPYRGEIPLYNVSDRIGQPWLQLDPAKIAGVVLTNREDEIGAFAEPDAVTTKIGENVADFLAAELRAGRIPPEFLPLQSGVGDIANAVLGALGAHPEIPRFTMYSEVLQDATLALLRSGKLKFASGCSLTLSPPAMRSLYEDLSALRGRIVLRPQEITNNPEIVRRIGIISVNTAIEADLQGNINSTHLFGKTMMNGIGGSGDFTRNAHLSIFTCPSLQKSGKISTIVPQVTHTDHSEHSVQVIVTEHGVADLRRLDPFQRAELIIERCAHPDFRADLRRYLALSRDGHEPFNFDYAFAFHQRFNKTGDMRGVVWPG